MKTFKPKVPGFLIGIKIVIVNMLKTLSPFHSKPNVNYPFEKEKVAQAIYNGGDTAATEFFQNKMSDKLGEKMRPLINRAMAETGVTRYYDALMDKASSTLPMLGAKKTDLGSHVTDATLKGLFLRLAQEEKQIRQNPLARSTDLLKSVFSR